MHGLEPIFDKRRVRTFFVKSIKNFELWSGGSMQKPDCLFCKIVAGEIPSNKVYEDERVYAFDDISPMMPVHTLIIPKNHYDNIAADIPDEDLAAMMRAVKTVAELKNVEDSGFRTIINTNDDSCQTVHHVHVHVLGGKQMNDGNPSLSD